jgi:hypothetical protein
VPESTGRPEAAPADPPQRASDLDAVVDELYALPPDAFVPARDDRVAAAKEAGDRDLARAVARLRRPTRAAWLANLLARHRTEELDGLVALARGLARAQQELDGDALRALSGQRHRVVAAMARDAGRLAARQGEPVSDALLREVAGILDAALADPAVAEEVRAGRLTKTVRYSGFGPAGGAAGDTAPDDDMAAWAASAATRHARTRRAGAGGGLPDLDAGGTGGDTAADAATGTAPAGDRERAERERAERERNERERAERERAAAARAECERALADAEAEEAAARERQEADEAARDRADERHAAARAQVAELARALDAARGEEQAALEAGREAAAVARSSARDAASAAVRTARARTRLEQLPPSP